MHELSIAMSLLELAEEEVAKLGPVRVEALHLRLGPLSGVVEEALVFSWEVAVEGTPLAGSRIVVERTEVRVFCATCDVEATADDPSDLRCATCRSSFTQVVAGRELELVGLEVVDAEAAAEQPGGAAAPGAEAATLPGRRSGDDG